ncbi:hypothetical protein [Sporosarcina ureae]|uniref:hypothetical protein n=1 Tax=Sporosarcina ureae TaxID=1571 RepID=UPI000A17E079|nr:hypothetical protein [Sporosarcina ureae]ARK22279.1 hypothetical protein SporoP32a_12530 [Sporosarcina ureae]PIC74204.1 hypothetical protein CSV76_06855 [Sporosarcina sp. P17b]
MLNELKRGTTPQLKTGRTPYTTYFAETEQAIYERNRLQCGAKSKLLIANEFIDLDVLRVRNIDLPMKLRRNTKAKCIRRNRCVLGMGIAERPVEIEDTKNSVITKLIR